jgi:hypothetical protein
MAMEENAAIPDARASGPECAAGLGPHVFGPCGHPERTEV